MEWLHLVLSRIADGTLLPVAYYGQLNCDAALDSRDDDDGFDADWSRCFKEVESRWAAAEVAADARALAEDIRRESFLAVSRATRQHEIASYVSDDFDLIVRSRLVDVQHDLLAQLWQVYERGEFPTPSL